MILLSDQLKELKRNVSVVNMLLNGKGKFLISGYEHPIYDKLVDNGWSLYKYDSVNACSDRTECLWYNYDIEENLFDEI